MEARGLIVPDDNSVKKFEKEFIFLIVTNSVMAFLAIIMIISTCCKRRDVCSGFALMIIFVAFSAQAIYYGLQY